MDTVVDIISSGFSGNPQGIFLIASIYALVVCLWSLVFQMRIRRWPCVEGKLHEAHLRHFGVTDLVPSQQEYTLHALYEYKVNGTSYVGKRVSPWVMVASRNASGVLRARLSSLKVSPDGRVAVYFHPKKPAKSFLIKPGFLSLTVTFLLGIAPLAAYCFKYA